MFLRWRHTKVVKAAHRKHSPGYVFKKGVVMDGQDVGGQHYFRDYPEKITERLKVAVVESHRVDGEPRTRVIAHLGGFDPRRPPEEWWGASRSMMARVRALDIPLALKEKFLKEIEARGVKFDWPATLEPIAPEEQAEIDAKSEARMAERWARIDARQSGAPPEAPPQDPVGIGLCDICTTETSPMPWVYPVKSFTLPSKEGWVFKFNAPWALCDECAEYAERDDFEGLAQKLYAGAHSIIKTAVENYLAAFKANRDGDRFRFTA